MGDVLPRGNGVVGKCKGIRWGSFLSPSPSPSALPEQGKGLESWEPLVPLAQAGMLCQDKAPVLSSACASRIPGVRLSFTKSPSFLKRLKLCFQKIPFFDSFFASPPSPPSYFLSPPSPRSSTAPCCHPALPCTHMERALSVIQALGAAFCFN